MADRLKQIWGEFAGRTSARLTSVDIDTVQRPSAVERAELRAGAAKALEAGHDDKSDAVQAAFAALHADIQRKAKRGGRRGGQPQASFDAEAEATSFQGLDDRLLADLKFTEARVRRSGSDYLEYAQKYHSDKLRRKRKKFLGIF
ncbi:hypothetical protein [Parvularcula lutaonensis]|uniref:Uncharacterized protein n=1 Tax=Parvularcula lutaonensis TaxID=491923 RepID=A0ABV7M7P4_9PROT|nr:hypothetical protein [Parvularcula lutaonensis]GGY42452.1 hypothetical protein GCM10007148_08880 [Parvularcula lutaonensis]